MRKKKIICYELGEIYESTRQAERKLNISNSDIVRCANGEYTNTHGLHFRYLDDLADCFIEEPEEDYTEEDFYSTAFEYNECRGLYENNTEILKKILTPLSVAVGVEVEKSIIDVLEHCIVTEKLDETGRYNLRFKFDFKE